MIMNRKHINLLSNASFWIALAMAAYAFLRIFLSRQGLPPGTCPIEDNRPILFVGIGFAVASLILSFAADKMKRRNTSVDEVDNAKNNE